MKKIVAILVAISVVFVFAACGTTGAATASAPAGRVVEEGMFPDFIMPYIMNAPENALLGIGTANMGTFAQSRTFSMNRARVEISRQLNSMVQDMITDYQAGSESDPTASASFQESISRTVSQADVSGAVLKYQNQTGDGTVWTVVELDKNKIAEIFNAAEAAAKLAVPQAKAMDAAARMDAQLAKTNAQPPQVGTTD